MALVRGGEWLWLMGFVPTCEDVDACVLSLGAKRASDVTTGVEVCFPRACEQTEPLEEGHEEGVGEEPLAEDFLVEGLRAIGPPEVQPGQAHGHEGPE